MKTRSKSYTQINLIHFFIMYLHECNMVRNEGKYVNKCFDLKRIGTNQ